jgi:hypothetical protein
MSAWNKAFAAVLRNSPRIVVSLMLITACGFAYKFYTDNQDSNRRYEELVGRTSDYEQISDSLAKLRTDYATEKELREKLSKEWSEAEKELKDKIKALADASFEGDSDNYEMTFHDEFGTHFYNKKDNKFGPLVTWTQVTGAKVVDGKVDTLTVMSGVVPHEIQVKAAITKNEETGKISILTKAFWLQTEAPLNSEISWLDKPYPLSITGGSIIIDPTEPIDITLRNRFRMAPHLNVGLFAGVATSGEQYGGHVDFSLWGYGKTKNDLEWKLGQIGLNFSKNYVDANLIPVSYNIGKHIPLVSDLYVGPGIGYGTEGRMFFVTLSKTL